jgi:predicted amidohydrolase
MSRIALLQAQTGIDPAENSRMLCAALREARGNGAAMLFTPEMSGLLDRDRTRAAANLKSERDDIVLAAVRDSAAREGVWVHLGSLAIRRDDGLLANRAFVIDPAGEVRATYDKLHLFDVDLPTGESWRESASYAPGAAAVVVEGTPVGRLGLSICYDIRFPALFSALTEAGADTIAVPAAFTVPTGKAHWEVLLRARAIEAGVFVVAAAQAGLHADGRETYGHSLVADPWGDLLLSMDRQPGLAFAELDLGRIAEVRGRVPAMSHRRPIPAVQLH